MSEFNDSKSFESQDTTPKTVSIDENITPFAVEKVTKETSVGNQVSISGGETVNGSLNTGLKRATEGHPVTFSATPASSSPDRDYYVHCKKPQYKVDITVTPSGAGSASFTSGGSGMHTTVEEGYSTGPSMTATNNMPCTFDEWTITNGGFTGDNPSASSQTLATGLLDDTVATAHFNCYVEVQDPTGDVYENPQGCYWGLCENNALVDLNNCCNFYKYPMTPVDIQEALATCSFVRFRAYSAYYEKVEDYNGFSYTYHARGWGASTDSGQVWASPVFTQPAYGSDTMNIVGGVSDLPLGEIMYFHTMKRQNNDVYNLEMCDIIQKYSDGSGYSFGSSYPNNVQVVESCYNNEGTCIMYTQDGQPCVSNFIYGTNGFSWGGFCLASVGTNEPRNFSNRWMVASATKGYFPRSPWLAVEPATYTGSTPNIEFTLDPDRFDISGLTSLPNDVTDVNDLLNNVSSTLKLHSSQIVWFELEVKPLNPNTTVANEGVLPFYYTGEVTFTQDGKIAMINNGYVTEDTSSFPEYIAYVNGLGVTEVYRKVVVRDELYRYNCGTDGIIGPDNVSVYENMSSDTQFIYGDNQCGTFNGWLTKGGQGWRTMQSSSAVGEGSVREDYRLHKVTLGQPNSCCQIFRPDITSCSDKYYPYGYFGDGAHDYYFRYAIIPYLDSNGDWASLPIGAIANSLDCNSIIENGMNEAPDDYSLDDVFFVLPGQSGFYSFGMQVLEPTDTPSEYEYYINVYSDREIYEWDPEEVPNDELFFKSTGYIYNNTNTDRYYRLAYYKNEERDEAPRVLTEYDPCKMSSYETSEDAFVSGEILMYADSIPDDAENYRGMLLKQYVVYKNDCTVGKGISLLVCTNANDSQDEKNIISTLSVEPRYFDYGITNSQYVSGLQRFTKQYVRVTSADFGYDTGVISWDEMGKLFTDEFHLNGRDHGRRFRSGARDYIDLVEGVQEEYGCEPNYYTGVLPFARDYEGGSAPEGLPEFNYRYNKFDGGKFGFSFDKFVITSNELYNTETIDTGSIVTYVFDRKYNKTMSKEESDPDQWQYWHFNGPHCLEDNPNMNNELRLARACHMKVGKFLLTKGNQGEVINNRLTLLTSNNISDYTDPTSYVIDPDILSNGYYTADGGIGERFIQDSTPSYTAGHYAYGTNENDEVTYGCWWPLDVPAIAQAASYYNLPTFHLKERVHQSISYSVEKRKYILIRDEVELDGVKRKHAYRYDSANSEWVQYPVFPTLIDFENFPFDGKLIVLREVDENAYYPSPDMYVAYNGNTSEWGYGVSTIEELRYDFSGGQLTYNDNLEDAAQTIKNDQNFLCFCVVLQAFGNEDTTMQPVAFTDLSVQDYYSASMMFNGTNVYQQNMNGAYNSVGHYTGNSDELVNNLEQECRYITADSFSFLYGNNESFTYDIYRLDNGNLAYEAAFGTAMSNSWNGTSFDASESGYEAENRENNYEVYIPITWNDDNITTLTEYYVNEQGFDKNGFYVGVPVHHYNQNDEVEYYTPYCGTLNDTQNHGVFKNLYCDCVPGNSYVYSGFMPETLGGNNVCTYKRDITYSETTGAYFVTKYGYYVNDEFIEVPKVGVKWLKASDGGVKRRLIDEITNSLVIEVNPNNGEYELTADLDRDLNDELKRDFYDYVEVQSIPQGSTAVPVNDASEYFDARDTYHHEYIQTTSDMMIELRDGGCARKILPKNKYYKLNYNYYKEISTTINNTPITLRLQFLGWYVEGIPKYELYCDAEGNVPGVGRVELPLSSEFVYVNDTPSDYVEINGVVPYVYNNTPQCSFEEVTTEDGLTSYYTVSNQMDLNTCLLYTDPFKVVSYDGHDITGLDGYSYEYGKFYEPNKNLLTTALKYGYPSIYVYMNDGSDIDYNGKHYNNGEYYVNKTCEHVIHSQGEMRTVLSRGFDYVFLAEYRKLGSPNMPGVTYTEVENVDELEQAISQGVEYITITSGNDIQYHYCTYESGMAYMLNKVAMNGITYTGGIYLKRVVSQGFYPVNPTISMQTCQTATAVFARDFKVWFCGPTHINGNGFGSCGIDLVDGNDISNSIMYTYDGELVTYNMNIVESDNPNDGDFAFSIDHRHFTGKHKLGFSAIEGWCGNNVVSDNQNENSCKPLNGFAVGLCIKDMQWNQQHATYVVETDVNEVNNIKNYLDGTFPICQQTLMPRGGCSPTRILTNDSQALFGEIPNDEYVIEHIASGVYNENYPYFNHLVYTDYGNDPEDPAFINTWYEWDDNEGEYRIVEPLEGEDAPYGFTQYNTYILPNKLEEGAYALKRKISVGVYKVHIQEAVSTDDIENMDILDWTASLPKSMTMLYNFTPYLLTGDYVEAMNLGFSANAYDFNVKPHTLYSVTYRKINNESETLSKSASYLELFLTVLDQATAPYNFWGSGYVELSATQTNLINGYVATFVTSQEELEQTILSNTPTFMLYGITGLEYNGDTFWSGRIYGNPMYIGGGTYAFISGGCGSNNMLRYMTTSIEPIQLQAPEIQIACNNGQCSLSITGTNNNDPNVQYRYKIMGFDNDNHDYVDLTVGFLEYDLNGEPVSFDEPQNLWFQVSAYAIGCADGYVDSPIAVEYWNQPFE